MTNPFAPGREIRVGVLGLGGRGMGHAYLLSAMPDVRVTAVCDNYGTRAVDAAQHLQEKFGTRPEPYTDADEMLKAGGFDAVAIITSWQTHMRLAIKALRAGYPVGMEIGAGQSLLECQDLVRTSEETGLPVMPFENCCYGEVETAILHMIQKGMFGTILHCGGGYEHELFDEIGNGDVTHHYRQPHFFHRNAELYPTHEMGPIAKYIGINRGNRILTVSSIASKAVGLREWLHKNRPELGDVNVREGDVVTSMLTCANGETITLMHKCTLPCCYSRQGRVDGTKGLWMENGNLIYLAGITPIPEGVWDHPPEPAAPYYERYRHPLWKAYEEYKNSVTAGAHGGMDYLVDRAWIHSLQKRIAPPLDVYDAVTWMAITVLSEQSVARGGMPQAMPDFTYGAWLTRGPAEGPFALDTLPE